jgi:hypothetical protein
MKMAFQGNYGSAFSYTTVVQCGTQKILSEGKDIGRSRRYVLALKVLRICNGPRGPLGVCNRRFYNIVDALLSVILDTHGLRYSLNYCFFRLVQIERHMIQHP